MRRRPQQVILHIVGCSVFLALPFLFSPESLNLHNYLTNPPTQRDIIAYILLLGAFYSNYYLLVPRLYFRRKYSAFIALNLLGLALVTFLPFGFVPHHFPSAFENTFHSDGLHSPNGVRSSDGVHSPNGVHSPDVHSPDGVRSPDGVPPGDFHPDNDRPPDAPPFFALNRRRPPAIHFFVNEHFFLYLVVFFLALLLKIRDRWIRAEDEKLHAELAYLKAQINPHFLFNTLNSIYAMALGRSEQTAVAIVRLSSMMRYVLVEAGKEKVPLEKELTYLTDYIQLQQTRFEGSLQLGLEINGQPLGKSIFPLLLIPFVENAFKYGVNPEEPSTIGIRIDIDGHDLKLKVCNRKVAIAAPDADAPGGLGIRNTRRRLQLLYPGRHSLEIEDEVKTFTVLLNLSGI